MSCCMEATGPRSLDSFQQKYPQARCLWPVVKAQVVSYFCHVVAPLIEQGGDFNLRIKRIENNSWLEKSRTKVNIALIILKSWGALGFLILGNGGFEHM